MITRSIILILSVFLFSTSYLISQAQYGFGKKQEFLDAFERISLKYDTTQNALKITQQSGFSFLRIMELLENSHLTRKDKWDIGLLKTKYPSFTDVFFSENKQSSFFKRGRIFSFRNNDVSVRVDPLIYFGIGRDRNNKETIFRNSRGFSISGNLIKKVFFRTSILENQARYFKHIERRIANRNAIPGQGFYKRYESGVFDAINGWDFLNAEGVLTYRPSEYFTARIGHGSFFLGNGYNSLLLSDYSDNFFFLELNTSIGIFNYKNIFAELAPIGSTIDQVGDLLAPKKYMATHYLSVAISKKLEISLYESVVFGRENNFEFQYLNPLILYRVVEQKLDSPDNVMLGLDINYKVSDKTKAYCQFLIDEMRVGEFFSGSGWWGNKVGYQFGAKHFGLFGIDHLDVQAEFNTVRPFTYAHRATNGLDYSIASYSHYNQELAHPLGANFREVLFLWKYRISQKWSIKGKFLRTEVGRSNTTNIGQDILLSTDTRENDYSNKTGQGDSSNIFQFSSVLSYHISHSYYTDLQFLYRNEQSKSEDFDVKSMYFGISFRANMSQQKLDY